MRYRSDRTVENAPMPVGARRNVVGHAAWHAVRAAAAACQADRGQQDPQGPLHARYSETVA